MQHDSGTSSSVAPYFTTTRIVRVWANAQRGIASLTTVCSDGTYDTDAKSFVQNWSWFDLSEPDLFRHEQSFTDALRRLQDPLDVFHDGVSADPTSFAQAVAHGHDFGRVLSEHSIWDALPTVAQDLRNVQLTGNRLRFSVLEPQTVDSSASEKCRILLYDFHIERLEVVSNRVMASI